MSHVQFLLQEMGKMAWEGYFLPALLWSICSLFILLFVKKQRDVVFQYRLRVVWLWILPLSILLSPFIQLELPTFEAINNNQGIQEGHSETLTLLPSQSEGIQDIALLDTSPTEYGVYFFIGFVSLLVLLWGSIQLAQFLRNIWALKRLRYALKPCQHLGINHWLSVFKKSMGINKRVRISTVKQQISPFTFGWLHPQIVLPESLLGEEQSFKMVLNHELIHIKRNDALWQLAEQLMKVFFGVFPWIYRYLHKLNFYREASCDALLFERYRVEKRTYATLLFNLITGTKTNPLLSVSMADKTQLNKRIQIMKTHTTLPKKLLLLRATIFGSSILLVTFILAGFTQWSFPQEYTIDANSKVEPEYSTATVADFDKAYQSVVSSFTTFFENNHIDYKHRFKAVGKKATLEGGKDVIIIYVSRDLEELTPEAFLEIKKKYIQYGYTNLVYSYKSVPEEVLKQKIETNDFENDFTEINLNKTTDLEIPADTPFIGNPDALLSIVYFTDYQCPGCKKADMLLTNLLKKFPNQLKIYYLNYPIDMSINPRVTLEIHPFAAEAAMATVCAERQGKFEAYKNMLYDRQSEIDVLIFEEIAMDVSLDTTAFASCMEEDAVRQRVKEDLDRGHQMKIDQTPTIFIGEKKVHSTRWSNEATLEEMVKEALDALQR